GADRPTHFGPREELADERVNANSSFAMAQSQSDSNDRSRVSLGTELEGFVLRFEKAWQTGQPPRIADFLPAGEKAPALLARLEVLKELIKIDLEFRWRPSCRSDTPGSCFLLETYLEQHPDLKRLAKVPLDLILEE